MFVAIAFAIATPFAQAAVSFPGWAVAASASANQQDDNRSKLSITAAQDIPRKASDLSSNAVVGFTFADLHSEKVLVATIHPAFRDSAQNPDSWHPHSARLTTGVNGHNFCIDSFLPNPQGGI